MPEVVKGAVPPGLSFNDNGDLVGTFTDKEPQEYNFTLRFEGENKPATLDVTLTTKPWPAPGRFTAIQGQASSFCGINEQRNVFCWGSDNDGQTGDGTVQRTNRPIPTPVVGIPDPVEKIRVEGSSSCAITTKSDVYCWGSNIMGVVDRRTHAWIIPEARRIEGLPSGITDVSLGFGHACATNGEVYCWGDSEQLSEGGPVEKQPPLKFDIPDDSPITSLSSNYRHTCATTESGTLWCWGSNSWGQLGVPNIDKTIKPVRVPNNLGAVKQVRASFHHTCALNTSGHMWCWGNFPGRTRSSNGQTGPVRMNTGHHRIVEIFGGSSGTCGKTATGKVLCFGSVPGLGRSPHNAPALPRPWQRGMKDVALGSDASCGLNDSGEVKCGGNNEQGATGINKLTGLTPLKPLKQFP